MVIKQGHASLMKIRTMCSCVSSLYTCSLPNINNLFRCTKSTANWFELLLLGWFMFSNTWINTEFMRQASHPLPLSWCFAITVGSEFIQSLNMSFIYDLVVVIGCYSWQIDISVLLFIGKTCRAKRLAIYAFPCNIIRNNSSNPNKDVKTHQNTIWIIAPVMRYFRVL